MTLERVLAGGLADLGLDLDAPAQAKLLAYLALLQKWNRTYNLTAIREPERMVTHHLLDSLATLHHLPQATSVRLVDIGSGAGLPGIPLAVARPAWKVTLLERNAKKGAFLRQAAAELTLRNVEVAATRAEDYLPAALFDVAISRALSDLAQFVTVARPLIAPGGCMFAMKGVYPHEELAHLPADVRVLASPALEVPGLDGTRHLVIMDGAPA
jgi:16S rRNA (guanine527-N7)-methyltransferase